MNKMQRVRDSLAGKDVDRPPVSFWYHFGTQHESGERLAELELAFYRFYDLDFIKVMNDYFYPMPEGYTELKTKEDLKAVQPFDVLDSPWAQQLKALDILASELKDEACFIDTVFDPWQVLVRGLVGEHLVGLLSSAPKEILAALDTITDNIISYCHEALRRGAAGIFLSTFCSEQQIPYETYMTFAYPFVQRIFAEIQHKAIMNTAHLHDYGIYTEDMVKLPAHILSWEDRDPSNPGIADMRKLWNGSVMAGMDKNKVTRVTLAQARKNALEGIAQGGKTKFFLAPGCSFPTWMNPEAGLQVVDAAKSATR